METNKDTVHENNKQTSDGSSDINLTSSDIVRSSEGFLKHLDSNTENKDITDNASLGKSVEATTSTGIQVTSHPDSARSFRTRMVATAAIVHQRIARSRRRLGEILSAGEITTVEYRRNDPMNDALIRQSRNKEETVQIPRNLKAAVNLAENYAKASVCKRDEKELCFKVIVIGDVGTGKTSIIHRYVNNYFTTRYCSTIGVEAHKKIIKEEDCKIIIDLHDICGQDRTAVLCRTFYKGASGVIIVYDVTRKGTYDSVSKWAESVVATVKTPSGDPVPCILLANKCDQPIVTLSSTKSKHVSRRQDLHILKTFDTSAKTSMNVQEAFGFLIDEIKSCSDIIDKKDDLIIRMTADSRKEDTEKCSC